MCASKCYPSLSLSLPLSHHDRTRNLLDFVHVAEEVSWKRYEVGLRVEYAHRGQISRHDGS
jgi:hypothetical protein